MSPLADVLVRAGSELPDPGKLSIVALGGLAGTFVGGLLPRIRRLPVERWPQMTSTGTWVGIGLGFIVWFGALAIDRL